MACPPLLDLFPRTNRSLGLLLQPVSDRQRVSFSSDLLFSPFTRPLRELFFFFFLVRPLRPASLQEAVKGYWPNTVEPSIEGKQFLPPLVHIGVFSFFFLIYSFFFRIPRSLASKPEIVSPDRDATAFNGELRERSNPFVWAHEPVKPPPFFLGFGVFPPRAAAAGRPFLPPPTVTVVF